MATVDALLGRLVDGRYEIVSRIARGGMATVYLATDRRLDREVAVKIMHAHLADGVDGASFVSRFRREARAAARLTHPGVVAVYDQGLDGDTSYLTMEYVPGTNLRRELRASGTLTLRRALDVLDQVLAALAAAHRKGLVHRDVKPENVLVTADGEHVKVADFGLARAVTEVTSTTTGTILGTVAYLAPEVISTGACDARADVYAVGILAYEMLTGTLPYPGETPIQVAFRHVHDDVPPPSDHVDWLPADVDALVAAFTARNPAQRPLDGDAALAELRRLRAGIEDDVLDRRTERAHDQAHNVGHPKRGTQDGAASDVEPTSPADPDGSPADDDAGAADGPDGLDAIPAAFFTGLQRPETDETAGAESTERLVDVSTGQLRTRESSTSAAAPSHGAPPAGTPVPVRNGRSRRRRVFAWFAAAILVVGGGAAGSWWWFEDGPGAWTRVPAGVVAAPLDDAREVLSGAGLAVEIAHAHDDNTAVGSVVRSQPAPGDRVRKDGEVRLVVSLGVLMVEVPGGLVGAPQAEATAALASAGFDVGEPWLEHDDETPKGTVMDVSVDEGSLQNHDTVVTLTVSDGPAPVRVPQQVGKEKDAAVADLQSMGLKVKTGKEEFSEDVPKGRVLRQHPEEGTQAHRTDTVTLTISAGPPIVAVPNVVGMSSAEAHEALEKAGFVVDENTYLGGLLDTVRFQDVEGEALKGSTVTLTIW
ncbi:MAG: Stk1 family PASTA domain-containing Ser/Thr kinase [Actinomycetota bacterium]|nr:Stk1 family PASTA domain-containing Ser/Thr kinase [Actinomycetota bacterium]